MVARTPPKLKKVAAAIDPALLRDTLKKVDRCMARLQELQYTVAGGRKVVSGISLSPRSTRGYLRTSLRCKQESLRIKSAAPSKSPVGKFPPCSGGEWRRMSLPAMLVGETVGEILQATQFAREVLSAVTNKTKPTLDEPRTPLPQQSKKQDKSGSENTELRSKRKKEKQNRESGSPSLQRARSRINFKVSPPKVREIEKDSGRFVANRVSPRNKPWARKAVLFPNPTFRSSPTKQQRIPNQTMSSPTKQQRLSNKTRSPHKFLIKSPNKPSSNTKFQVKIKSPPKLSISPTRNPSKTTLNSSNLKRSFSPSKLRRSFSPARIANRLLSMSPLKGRKNLEKKSCDGLVMSGLKQRPAMNSALLQLSTRRAQVQSYC